MQNISIQPKNSNNTTVLPAKHIPLLFTFTLLFVIQWKLVSQVTTTFSYTGAMQTYVVPAGINYLRVDASGAQGGVGPYGPGGYGGRVTCTIAVIPGSTLNVFVGQMPYALTGGYNGGGNAAAGFGSAAGGGATDIRIGGIALANRILVAGGGGGSGFSGVGAGGSLTGGTGGTGGAGVPATGGTQSAGGVGGLYSFGNCSPGAFAQNGSLGLGGDGIAGVSGCTFAGGPGGGGGYYGGGGMQCSGAAGGSSYTDGSASNVIHTQGYRTGSGLLTLVTLFDVAITHTNVSCYGSVNGSAIAVVSSGSVTGPYTYSWIPAGGSSSIATGLSPGSYTCVVSTPGYTTYATTTITEPAVFSISISSQTQVTCFNGTNGAVVLNPTGGTAPYSYTWSPSVSTASVATGLVAGTYTATIREMNNCGTVQQAVTITQPPSFTVSGSAGSSTICNGGLTSLNGSGATNYTWTGSVANGSPFSPTITTTYSVTGTNSAGCLSSNSAAVTVTVHSLPVITVNSGAICIGQTFTMIPGGASTYTYSNGSSTASPTITASYSVTGASSVGCLSTNAAVSSVTVNALPVITVNSGTICSGTSFTLTPGGAYTYTYTGGNAVVSPTANNSYSVSGTSIEGCISTFVAVSNVTVITTPTVSVNSGSICEGQSFTLTPSGASNYTFSGGNNVVTPSVTLSYTVSGANLAGSCISNPAISSVTVYALPVLNVNSGTICTGESFTINPTGGSSYSISGGTAIVSPSANSTYTVVGYSAQGCISTNTVVSTLLVKALPTLTLSGAAAVCSGNSITQLVNTSAISYTWNNGSMSNIVVLSPTLNTVCSVTVTGSNGCTNFLSKQITVHSLPVVSVAASNQVLCAGAGLTLSGNGALTYTWTGNVQNNIVFYPTGSGTYTVTGFDANGCMNSAVMSIVVNPLPNVTYTSSATTICIGEPVTLTAFGASTYTWNGNLTGTTLVDTPASMPMANYLLTGTDTNGCVSTTLMFALSVQGCVGVVEFNNTNNSLLIYPNPNNGEFTLRLNSISENTMIEIYNSLGELILTRKPVDEKIFLDFKDKPNGIYSVSIRDGAGNANQLKMIKD